MSGSLRYVCNYNVMLAENHSIFVFCLLSLSMFVSETEYEVHTQNLYLHFLILYTGISVLPCVWRAATC